jgi:hypothetical protein
MTLYLTLTLTLALTLALTLTLSLALALALALAVPLSLSMPCQQNGRKRKATTYDRAAGPWVDPDSGMISYDTDEV